MKNNLYKVKYILCIALFLIMSCTKENTNIDENGIEQEQEDTENLSPNQFSAKVEDVSSSTAILTWNEAIDPESDVVTYSIYLDEELVAENISEFSYQIKNLKELTSYSGKIIAIDSNNNKTEVVFSFITSKYYLKFLKTFDYGIGQRYNGAAFGNIQSMLKTSDGNYIIVCKKEGVKSIMQFYLLKIDTEGNEIWNASYDYEIGDAYKYNIKETSNGLVVAALEHVLFLDKEGNLIWHRKIVKFDFNNAFVGLNGVTSDADDNIYVIGERSSSTIGVSQQGVLVKLDVLGNILWEKIYEPSRRNMFEDIMITDDNHLIVLGSTDTNGAKEPEDEQIDFWLLKMNTEGEVIWQKTYGDGRYDFPSQVMVNSKGNYVFVGYGWGAYDVSSGRIFEVDSNGQVIINVLTNLSRTNSIIETTEGGYITTGHVNFGDYGGLGIYKFDSFGNEEWNKIIQKDFTYLHGISIYLEEDGGYFIGGSESSNYGQPFINIFKTDPFGNFK